MSASFYMRQLQVRRVIDNLATLDIIPFSVELKVEQYPYFGEIEDVVEYQTCDIEIWVGGGELTPLERETNAANWLARFGGQLRRTDGMIQVFGELSHGMRYRLSFGQGVCERVVVGQRWVEEQPAVPAHYEDVTEVICA